MTFRQMEIFIAISEEESINKAAAVLFISQQGISKMLRELEEELGCQLLERTQKGVKLTQCGRYFLGECRIMVEKKTFLTNHIAHIKCFPQEVISLGMAFGVIAVIHYKNLLAYETQYPHVHIEYSDQADFYLEHLLHKGEYDFCVTTGVLNQDEYISEHIREEKVFLSIPVNHPFYYKKEIKMEELNGQSFAMFSTQFHIRHEFEHCCKQAGVSPHIALSSSDFNSLKEVAKENNLLFIVPEHTINPDDHSFKYTLFPDTSLCWNIYFVRRKNKILSDNCCNFYQFLKETLTEL